MYEKNTQDNIMYPLYEKNTYICMYFNKNYVGIVGNS